MRNTINGLFNKSLAFLDVAILSSKAKDTDLYDTSEYSNVTAYLFYHATELFLKFAICASTNKIPKKDHDIKKLHERYIELYPAKQFYIEIPFTHEVDYLGFTEEEIEKHKQKYSMPIDQQLRYPVGKKGENYQPITIYEADILEQYKEQFLRLRCEIYPCENA